MAQQRHVGDLNEDLQLLNADNKLTVEGVKELCL